MRIWLVFLFSFVSLLSANLNIDAGKWNLISTTTGIDTSKDASSSCNIFGFDYLTQSYVNYTSENTNIPLGTAIFVYAKSASCVITQTQTVTAPSIQTSVTNAPPSLATYQVTVQSLWSSGTHPKEYPSGAHFSKPVVVFGGENDIIFKSGERASEGVKSMAETGSVGILSDEIDQLVNIKLKIGSTVATPSSEAINIETTSSQPYLSFTSMLAPSPDWFVGVDRMLLLEQGVWVQEKSVDLFLYDAGTDDGETYKSPNAPTNPRGIIEHFTSSRLGFSKGAPKVGILIIKKIN